MKFKIDRLSLEKFYFSFIRPILEYADVIWDNLTSELKQHLESINNEAARIVTGATKFCSIHLLYEETGWETLAYRRKKHRLVLFFKMYHGLTPEYLGNLVPSSNLEIHSYPTRNRENLATPLCKSSFYYNFFLPSTVRDWNDIPIQIRNNPSVHKFKKFRDKSLKIPKYYYEGSRLGQIYHTRLRLECSALNDHLFKKNIVNNNRCSCGEIESTKHFLLQCPLYQDLRQNSLFTLPFNINLKTILYGDTNLNFVQNRDIFLAVQKYIVLSKQFS